MTTMTQIEYVAQEFRETARVKRRQAEILCTEAETLERSADRVVKALEVDKARAAKEAT